MWAMSGSDLMDRTLETSEKTSLRRFGWLGDAIHWLKIVIECEYIYPVGNMDININFNEFSKLNFD